MNILIVEDEEDVCLAMVERLRELRGRAKDNIYHTFSAIPALEILRRHPSAKAAPIHEEHRRDGL